MTAELVCAATDPAWLERRREGITATDIVTIAGLVTWDSPWALYHRKLGLLPEPVQSDRMRLGSWLEDRIIHEWHESTGDLRDITTGTDLYRSSARLWQLATPDRVIRRWVRDKPATTQEILTGVRMSGLLGGDTGGRYVPDAVLECKTWDERQGKAEWGPDGSDIMPRKVKVQSLWQMDTLGVGTGHVAVVFLPSGEFRSYTIRHDHKDFGSSYGRGAAGSAEEAAPTGGPGPGPVAGGIESIRTPGNCPTCDEIDGLRDLGFGFWSRILRREPPDLDGLEVTTDALRYLHPAPGGQEEVDYGLVESYDWHKMHEAESKRMAQKALNEIRGQMGDAHEATLDGRVVFRRTIGKRAGYTVPPGETDILRRIGKDKD